MEIIKTGQATVTAIMDVEGELPLDEVIGDGTVAGGPDLPVPVTELSLRYPDEFTARSWRLRCRCFLIQTAGHTVLVDAGIGPADSAIGRALGTAGRLPHALAELGVAYGDVQHVVLTHYHDDHTGWCACAPVGDLPAAASAGGTHAVAPVPTFANAVYHLHPADLAAWTRIGDGAQDSGVPTALLEAGQLRADPDDYDVVPQIGLRHTPGHTPGHRCVLLRTGQDRVVFAGDLLHFGLQVNYPQFSPRYDTDPLAAAVARRRVLEWVSRDGWWLAATHLPVAFAQVSGPPGAARLVPGAA